ncbi:MAG: cupin domain-containing protein [Proteobacteria bacterium]|nr:cupin domain-containing protein [Pseudomonadota bacterium]
MIDHDIELLAAEYALGTLDKDERHKLEQRSASDPLLQQCIKQWELRLARLDIGDSKITPSAKLWDAIMSSVNDIPLPGTLTVRASTDEWNTIAPGAEVKYLNVDTDTGFQSYLLRLKPGTRLDAHSHTLAEECLVLEGDLQIGETSFFKGDYHLVPAGIPHPEITSESGALIFIRGEIREAHSHSNL